MSARRTASLSLSLGVLLLFAGCPGGASSRPDPDGSKGGGLARHGVSPVAPVRKGPLTDFEWKTFEKLAFDGEGTVVEGSLRVSPDGRRYACAVKLGDTTAWIVDGRKVAEFPVVVPAHFVFSGDSRHYLCAGGVDFHEFSPPFVLDGKRLSEEIRGILGSVWLSQDGSQYAYLVTDASSRNYLVVDGEEAIRGNSSSPGSDYFMPSSFGENLVVCSAGPKLRWAIANFDTVIVDGKQLKHGGLPNFERLHFSADGSSYAFLAQQDGEKFLVVNDRPQKRYENAWAPALSADGDHWALLVSEPAVVVDGEKFPTTTSGDWPIVFSPDGSRWAVRVLEDSYPDGQGHIVVDGERGETYATVGEVSIEKDGFSTQVEVRRGTVVFSPDAKHVAYAAGIRIDDDDAEDYGRDYRFVVLDDQEGPRFGWVDGTPVFSPDSRRLAYWTAEKEEGPVSLVVDGEIVAGPFQKRLHDEKPDYFPDRRSYREDRGFPVLSFSPDSRSVGAMVRDDDEWKVSLDGKLRSGYDRAAPERTRAGFTPEGSYTYLAMRGGDLYWVEESRDGAAHSAPFNLPDAPSVEGSKSSTVEAPAAVIERSESSPPSRGRK
jgi:hypothetical protein